MLNKYETVFILTPVLSDDQAKETVKKFKDFIKENKGKVTHDEDWGLKKLAYPIQKKSTGFYYLLEFEATGDTIRPMEVAFKRDERVLRFLTTRMSAHHMDYAEKRKAKLKSNSKSSAEA